MNREIEIIDTHAHLYLPEFEVDRDLMIGRALETGVSKVLLPNIDVTSIDPMMDLVKKYPGVCYPMMGLHPCSVKQDYTKQLHIIEAWLARYAFSAIGEIGTDLYWDLTFKEEQEACFRQQLDLAKDKSLPVVIHSRESLDWNIEIVGAMQDGTLGGIFHCFTGTAEQARMIMDLGFYLGIGGVVTFRNSGLSEVVKELPLEYLVLETDAPYLTPHPFRGKRNEPGYIQYVVEKIAECKGISPGRVCEITSQNARKIFKVIE
jgi:TatD DNase family protein